MVMVETRCFGISCQRGHRSFLAWDLPLGVEGRARLRLGLMVIQPAAYCLRLRRCPIVATSSVVAIAIVVVLLCRA